MNDQVDLKTKRRSLIGVKLRANTVRNGQKYYSFRFPFEVSEDHAFVGVTVPDEAEPLLLFEHRPGQRTLTEREAATLLKYAQEVPESPYPIFTMDAQLSKDGHFTKHDLIFKPPIANKILPGTAVGDALIFSDMALKRLAFGVDFDRIYENPRPRDMLDSYGIPNNFSVRGSVKSTDQYRRIWIEVAGAEAVLLDSDRTYLFLNDPLMRIRQKRQTVGSLGKLEDVNDDADSSDAIYDWIADQWSQHFQQIGQAHEKSVLKLVEFRKFIDAVLYMLQRNVLFDDVRLEDMASPCGDLWREIPVLTVSSSQITWSGGVDMSGGGFSLGRLIDPRPSDDQGYSSDCLSMADILSPRPGGADLSTSKTIFRRLSLSHLKTSIKHDQMIDVVLMLEEEDGAFTDPLPEIRAVRPEGLVLQKTSGVCIKVGREVKSGTLSANPYKTIMQKIGVILPAENSLQICPKLVPGGSAGGAPPPPPPLSRGSCSKLSTKKRKIDASSGRDHKKIACTPPLNPGSATALFPRCLD
eukprot:m.177525 g.177525  ORF g.177525 m.177525 type:complete len:525 (+) comp39162_c0_seq25:2515-4089(+)